VRLRLGMGRRAPSAATFRRVLQRVDPDELDTAVSGWLARRVATASSGPASTAATCGGPVRAIAVDSKTARGARRANGRAVHMLGALGHRSGVMLDQGGAPEGGIQCCDGRMWYSNTSPAIPNSRTAMAMPTIHRCMNARATARNAAPSAMLTGQ